MAEKKTQLSVFWGTHNLFFVETAETKALKAFAVSLEQNTDSKSQFSAAISGGMQLTSVIQNSLAQHKIIAGFVNLSLPTREIIFRSFVIPWMQSGEIKSVVEFEVIKYIPFTLEELAYAFHSMTIVEENTKKIRIVFIAIKKATLDKFVNALEQASLIVNFIEPAPISLIRVLSFNKIISFDETVAIIKKNTDSGNIIIIDKGIPQFVREFQLRSPLQKSDNIDTELINARMINEIKISLDYFSRQDNLLQLKKIIFLSSEQNENLIQKLKDELKVDTSSMNFNQITDDSLIDQAGLVHAYGVGLIGLTPFPSNLDLSDRKAKQIKMGQASFEKALNLKSIIKTAVVCIPLIFFVFLLMQQMAKQPKKKLDNLSQELGIFKGASTDNLKEENSQKKEDLDHYENIRLKSNISFFLEIIPTLLPQGTWIKSLDIQYKDSLSTYTLQDHNKKKFEPIVKITGYAYLDNTREQFRLVNQLLKNLEDKKDFSDYFDKINLETVESQILDTYTVTYFKIRCE